MVELFYLFIIIFFFFLPCPRFSNCVVRLDGVNKVSRRGSALKSRLTITVTRTSWHFLSGRGNGHASLCHREGRCLRVCGRCSATVFDSNVLPVGTSCEAMLEHGCWGFHSGMEGLVWWCSEVRVDRMVGDHKEAKVTQTTCRQSLQKSVPDCTTCGVHISLIIRHLVLARCTSFSGR